MKYAIQSQDTTWKQTVQITLWCQF